MSKRYFWLKLKEDFFQDDAIEWLEEQENGKEYCLFYLKLCLKALKDDGKLIRKVGNMLVPYTPEKLAEVTRTKVDTVMVAMNVLQRIGLVEYMEGERAYYIPQLQNMVGSEAANANAQRQKRFREKKKNEMLQSGVTNSNALSNESSNVPVVTNNNVELRDKSIEIRDKSIDNNHHNDDAVKDVFTLWNSNIMPLTPIIGEKLATLVQDYGEAIVSDAIIKAVQYGKRNFAYVAAVAKGIAAGSEKPQKEEMPF